MDIKKLHSVKAKRVIALFLTALMLCTNFLDTGLALLTRASDSRTVSVRVNLDAGRIVKTLNDTAGEGLSLGAAELPVFGTGEDSLALSDEMMANLEDRLNGLVLVEVQLPDVNTAALVAVELRDVDHLHAGEEPIVEELPLEDLTAPETDTTTPEGTEPTVDTETEEPVRDSGAASVVVPGGGYTIENIARVVLIGVNTSSENYVFLVTMNGGELEITSAVLDVETLTVEEVRKKEEVPAVPPAPVVPGTPAVPGTPETPVVPGTPETPAVPGTPETPVVPGTPETPVVPGTPETPVVPGTPETPVVPGTPETPVVPGTPETPVVPETPETPVVPGTPETPVVPEAPAESAAPVEPEPEVTFEVSAGGNGTGDGATPGTAGVSKTIGGMGLLGAPVAPLSSSNTKIVFVADVPAPGDAGDAGASAGNTDISNDPPPAPDAGKGDAVTPAPDAGKGDAVTPAPDAGKGEAVTPAPDAGKDEAVVPAPDAGDAVTPPAPDAGASSGAGTAPEDTTTVPGGDVVAGDGTHQDGIAVPETPADGSSSSQAPTTPETGAPAGGGAVAPVLPEEKEVITYVAHTRTVTEEQELSDEMLNLLMGRRDGKARNVSLGYAMNVSNSGISTLSMNANQTATCTLITDNVEKFKVDLYDYNWRVFNYELTKGWTAEGDVATMAGERKRSANEFHVNDKGVFTPDPYASATEGKFGWPDTSGQTKAIQGIVKDTLGPNGELVYNNEYNNALPYFPTTAQMKALEDAGMVEKIPTPIDSAAWFLIGMGWPTKEVAPSKPYSEFRKDWDFPIQKVGDYYLFDSMEQHIDRVEGDTSYALHADGRTHVNPGNGQTEGTFSPFAKDSIIPGPASSLPGVGNMSPEYFKPDGTGMKNMNSPMGRYFGMKMSFDFVMPENGMINGEPMVFEFQGDDDVYIFIDDQLVLDIGGDHGAVPGSINFSNQAYTTEMKIAAPESEKNNTNFKVVPAHSSVVYRAVTKGNTTERKITAENVVAGLKPGTSHTFTMFYGERGGTSANLYMRFNIPKLTGVTVTKEVKNANGFFDDADKNREFAFNLDVDGQSEGIFNLADGQSKNFDSLLVDAQAGKSTLKVTETPVAGFTTSYVVSGGKGNPISGTGESVSFDAIPLSNYSVAFTNTKNGNYSDLVLTKKLAENSEVPADTKFPFKISFMKGDSWVPYAGKIAGKSADVVDGLVELSAGESVTISGIPAGTKYKIEEVKPGVGAPVYSPSEITVNGVTAPREDGGWTITGTATTGTDGKNGIDTVVFTNDKTPPVFDPEMVATKTAVPVSGQPGVYDVTVTVKGTDGQKLDANNGAVAVKNDNVVLTDPMGQYATFVSMTTPNTGAYANNQITWNLGTLTSGTTYTMTYRVKMNTAAEGYNGVVAPAANTSFGYKVDETAVGYPLNGKTMLTWFNTGDQNQKSQELTVPKGWQQQNTLTIKKVDQDGNALAGADFTVTAPEGANAPAPVVTYLNAAGDTVAQAQATTFVVSNLYDYKYTVSETTVPTGATKVDDFDVDYSGLQGATRGALTGTADVSMGSDGIVTVKNTKNFVTLGSVKITKEFTNPDTVNANSPFNFVLTIPNGKTVNVTVNAGLADKTTSDITPLVKTALGETTELPVGEYTLTETVASGFRLDGMTATVGGATRGTFADGKLTFNITASDEKVDIVLAATNENIRGKGFTLEKVLNTNGLPTEDFTFELYKGTDITAAPVATGTTGAYTGEGTTKTASITWNGGFDPSTLDKGEYTLVEGAPKATSNYVFEKFTVDGTDAAAGNQVTFTVTTDKTPAIKAYNGPATSTTGNEVIVESKLLSGFGLPNEEFTYALKSADGTVIPLTAPIINSSDLSTGQHTAQVVKIDHLPNGVYTLTQTRIAASNYNLFDIVDSTNPSNKVLVETYTFTITTETGSTTPIKTRTITVSNKAKELSGLALNVVKNVDGLNVPAGENNVNKTFTFVLKGPGIATDGEKISITLDALTGSKAFPARNWQYGTYTLTEVTDNAYYNFVSATGKLGDRNYISTTTDNVFTFNINEGTGTNTTLTVTFVNNQKDAGNITIAKTVENAPENKAEDTFTVDVFDAATNGTKVATVDLKIGEDAKPITGLKVGGTYYLEETKITAATNGYEKVGFLLNGTNITPEAVGGRYKFTVDAANNNGYAITAVNKNATAGVIVKKTVEGAYNPYPDRAFAFTTDHATEGNTFTLTNGLTNALKDLRIGGTYIITETPDADYTLKSVTIKENGTIKPAETIESENGKISFTMKPGYANATIEFISVAKTNTGALTAVKVLDNVYGVTAEDFTFNLYRKVGTTETLYASAVLKNGDAQWTLASGGTPVASLTNLPVGDYVFEETLKTDTRFGLESITVVAGENTLPDTDASANKYGFKISATTGDIAISVTNKALDTGVTGGLKLVKSFTADAKWTGNQAFTVNIKGIDNNVNYNGTITVPGDNISGQTVVWTAAENTPAPVLTTEGALVLPVGKFTVTETGFSAEQFAFNNFTAVNADVTKENSKYTLTIDKADVAAVATLTAENRQRTGAGLTLEKELLANGLAAEDFTFTLTKGQETIAYGIVKADATYAGNKATVAWFSDAEYTTSTSVANLVVGKYTVTETSGNKNFSFKEITGVAAENITNNSFTFEVKDMVTAVTAATFVNEAKRTGEITFEKVIVGGNPYEDDFKFTLKNPALDHGELSNTFYTKSPEGTIRYPAYTQDVLKTTLTNLPYGEYTMTETEDHLGGAQGDHFTTKITATGNETIKIDDATRTISFTLNAENPDINIVYTNTIKNGSITIEKELAGGLGEFATRDFIFDLYQNGQLVEGKSQTLTYTNGGANTVTFDVPYGIYEVRERSDDYFTLTNPDALKNIQVGKTANDVAVTVTAENQRNIATGSVTVEKLALGADNLPSEKFTFTLTGGGLNLEGTIASENTDPDAAKVLWTDKDSEAPQTPRLLSEFKLGYGTYTLTETTVSKNFTFEKAVSDTGILPESTTVTNTFTINKDNASGNHTITLSSMLGKDGTIDLTKVFTDNRNNFPDTEFEFTVKGPKGTDSTERTMTVNAAGDWKAALANLPYGEYTITEKANDNFTFAGFTSHKVDGVAPQELVITVNGNNVATAITAENTLRTGTLVIKKELLNENGLGDLAERTFNFTLTKPDGTTESQEVKITGDAKSNSITLSNMSYGSYSMAETADELFALDTGASKMSGVLSSADNSTLTLTAMNSRKISEGEIIINKVVIGGENVVEETFNFTLTGPSGTFNGTASSKVGSSKVSWTKNGTPATLTGLQEGNYTLTEAASNNFTLTSVMNGETPITATNGGYTFALDADGVVVTATNTIKSDATVNLTKEIVGGNPFNDTFKFTLTGPKGANSTTREFTTTADDLANTWTGLPYGEYTLTEAENSNFNTSNTLNGGDSVSGRSVTFTLDGSGLSNQTPSNEANVTFTNTLKTDGTIKVVKTVTGELTGADNKFVFTLYDDTNAPVGEPQTITYTAGSENNFVTFTGLTYGKTYKVVEAENADFTLETEEAAMTATITSAAPNQTIEVINDRVATKAGSVIVNKLAIGAKAFNSTEDFLFTLEGVGQKWVGKIASVETDPTAKTVLWKVEGAEDSTYGPLPALVTGSYTLTETTNSKNFTFEKAVSNTGILPESTSVTNTFTINKANANDDHIITLSSLLKSDGSIKIQKTFTDGKNPFPAGSFTFKIVGPGVNQTRIVTAPDWTASLEDLPYGEYTITEESDVNFTFAGFTSHSVDGVAPQELKIAVNGDGKEVLVTGENTVKRTTPDQAALTITKTFSGNRPFDETFTFVLTDYAGGTREVTVNKDSNWTVALNDLAYGTYTLTEKVAPASAYSFDSFTAEGATVDGNKVTFTLGAKEKELQKLAVTAQNKVKTSTIRINATTRISSGENLSDQLRTLGYTLTYETTPQNYEVVTGLSDKQVFTTADGVLTNLTYGTYKLVQNDSSAYSLEKLSSNGAIPVTELKDGDRILGYQFILDAQSEGKSLTLSYVSGPKAANVTLEKKLASGNLISASDTFSFKVWEDGTEEPKDANLTVTLGEKTNVPSLKMGVKYRITEVLPKTSGYQFSSLQIGGNPMTNEGNAVYSFIATSPEAVELVATNILKTVEINLHKVNQGGASLSGAQFALNVYNPDGTYGAEIARLTSDANGMIHFGTLPLGQYVLTETLVPNGYQTPTTATLIKVEMGIDGLVVLKNSDGLVLPDATVTITNRRTGGGGGGGGDDGGGGGGGGTTTDIGENDVPLGGLEVIEDNLVPLANLPETGGFPVELLALAGAGFVGSGLLLRKKRVDEEETPENGTSR